jgi:hypothetical protein
MHLPQNKMTNRRIILQMKASEPVEQILIKKVAQVKTRIYTSFI